MPTNPVSWRPPFKVFGFIRSGNHLLAATLQRAFFPGIPPRVVEKNSGTGHWSQRHGPASYLIDGEDQGEEGLEIPYGAILGSHVMPKQRRVNPKAIVYIMRDGRDTLSSCYNWAKLRRKSQEGMTFSEYIRTRIDWRGTPGIRHDPVRGYTILHHWRDHVAAWEKAGAFLVRYEGVARVPKHTVLRVAKRFGLAPEPKWKPVGPVGWQPSGGKIRVGAWRHEWNPEDLDYFDQVVGRKFVGRYDVALEADYWAMRHRLYPDIRAVGHCSRPVRYNDRVYAEASKQLADMLRDDGALSVLDLGYGHGHHAKTCKRAGVETYHGVDFASRIIPDIGPGYTFKTADFTEKGFSAGKKFDVVILIDVAYHVVADERFRRLLETVKRHARKAVYVTGLFEDGPDTSGYCRHRSTEAFLSIGTPTSIQPWRDNYITRFEVTK